MGSGDMVGVNAGELVTAATEELLMAAPVQSKRQKIVKKREISATDIKHAYKL